MPPGRCHVHCPVAGASHVRLPPLLYALEGTRLPDCSVMRAIGRANEFPELVLQPFNAKIALLFGNPFLQAKMRLDDELRHPCPPCANARCPEISSADQKAGPIRGSQGIPSLTSP